MQAMLWTFTIFQYWESIVWKSKWASAGGERFVRRRRGRMFKSSCKSIVVFQLWNLVFGYLLCSIVVSNRRITFSIFAFRDNFPTVQLLFELYANFFIRRFVESCFARFSKILSSDPKHVLNKYSPRLLFLK